MRAFSTRSPGVRSIAPASAKDRFQRNDHARKRLRASQTILNRFRDQHLAIQKRLIELARAEIDDALEVLQDTTTPQPFYPVPGSKNPTR